MALSFSFIPGAMDFLQDSKCISFWWPSSCKLRFLFQRRDRTAQMEFCSPRFSPVFPVSVWWNLWRKIWQEGTHMLLYLWPPQTSHCPTSLHSASTNLSTTLDEFFLPISGGFCPRWANVIALLSLVAPVSLQILGYSSSALWWAQERIELVDCSSLNIREGGILSPAISICPYVL